MLLTLRALGTTWNSRIGASIPYHIIDSKDGTDPDGIPMTLMSEAYKVSFSEDSVAFIAFVVTQMVIFGFTSSPCVSHPISVFEKY